MPRNYYIPWYQLNEFMDHINWFNVKRAEVRPFSKEEVSVDIIMNQNCLNGEPFLREWKP